LLDQTNGDYETALKILERILEQRAQSSSDQSVTASSNAAPSQPPQSLEQRVDRLEAQLSYLLGALDTMNKQLTLVLDKLPGPDAAP
jgi:hypothetical protein